MKALLGMSLAELQDIVAQHNLPKFTAKQLVDWLYRKRVTTFEEMTNLSKTTRQLLAENYVTGYRAFEDVQEPRMATSRQRISLKKNALRSVCRARWDVR